MNTIVNQNRSLVAPIYDYIHEVGPCYWDGCDCDRVEGPLTKRQFKELTKIFNEFESSRRF